MKFLFFLFCCGTLLAEPIRHEFLIETFPMIYYLEEPEGELPYPLVLSMKSARPRKAFSTKTLTKTERKLLEMGVGLVSLGARGIDFVRGHNETLFFQQLTITQRVKDYVAFIQHLREHPPERWNGQIILLADPKELVAFAAVKVASQTELTGCITGGGWGEGTFQDYVWIYWNNAGWRVSRWLMNLRFGPFWSKADFDKWCQVMKDKPTSTEFWGDHSHLYWADALDQRMDTAFYQLKCPLLYFMGTEHVALDACDRMVEKGKKQGENITYIHIPGDPEKMDDLPSETILDFIRQLKPSA